MTLTPAELTAFRTGADFTELCAVSRSITGPERDQARYDELAWDLGIEYESGRISAGEYATRIAEAARRGGV